MKKKRRKAPPQRKPVPKTPAKKVSRRGWFALAAGGAVAAGLGGFLLAKNLWWGTPYTYEIVNEFPHQTDAFTQGLIFSDGYLYEGTGQYDGQSELRQVDLSSGAVRRSAKVNDLVNAPMFGDPRTHNVFGEGIARWGDSIFQLTWREGLCIVSRIDNFQPVRRFTYFGEGWGLTHDGRHLIMSDGSDDELRFLDPATFVEHKRLPVRWAGNPVTKLNELEYIKGEIYANVWGEDYIVRISPATGEVTAWLDLTELRPRQTTGDLDRVLNGIAYDAERDRLFVTGKNWPTLYEIREVRSFF